MFATLDVSDLSAVLECIGAFGQKTGGRLDILFSNAGIDAKGAFADMSWELILRVLNVNLVGSLAVTSPEVGRPISGYCQSSLSDVDWVVSLLRAFGGKARISGWAGFRYWALRA